MRVERVEMGDFPKKVGLPKEEHGCWAQGNTNTHKHIHSLSLLLSVTHTLTHILLRSEEIQILLMKINKLKCHSCYKTQNTKLKVANFQL